MEHVYKNNEIDITFHPHDLGSLYQITLNSTLLKHDVRFIVEENTMEDLWNSKDVNHLGNKIRNIDDVLYQSVSRGNIERLLPVLKKVKEDYEENVRKFVESNKNL